MADQTQQKRSYKGTLNLPKTRFSMKANLVQNEPASMKRWAQLNLYQVLRDERQGAPRFVFHDGPPYANGSIHLGHLLNKVLKDFVVRTTSMMGRDTPFVPGWDCHGLPIEHKVVQELGERAATMAPMQIRQRCRDYAEKYVKLQAGQMQRLLTLADYERPYLTMNPAYEAAVLEVFATLVERGIVYRGLKPVHWSVENRTALAEAELEYDDREDISIYVNFELTDESAKKLGVGDGPAALMIWTTTPWTLPANLAVAVQPKAEYGVYEVNGQRVVLAVDLARRVLEAGGAAVSEPRKVMRGSDLVGLTYRHPFIEGEGRVVAADYVTLEDGTGLVHTAPGHGTEDYYTGIREGLDIYCPVQADGTFDDTVPDWLRGRSIWPANDQIVEHLRESRHLFHAEKFTHSYPHDWRGKSPVIFRATEQWFVDVDKPFGDGGTGKPASLRQRALDVTGKDVRFIPEWGRNRMRGMLESRPDWCLSRQRAWGLPIPAFYGPEPGQVLLTPASVRAVANVIRAHGSDAWFKLEPADLLTEYDADHDPHAPDWLKNQKPETRNSKLTKGHDIFDVWFESGSSWYAVIVQRFGDKNYPTDLYLEGSDQHRGWFQLSLLPALGVTGLAPFKSVLTHGFMVDREGRKMSKSLGNTLEVEDLLKNYGADVCRWWVSGLSYEGDIKVDEEFFRLAGEEYRKVRNTIRFLLSNLNDFDVTKDSYTFTDVDATTIDAWALRQLDVLIERVTASYSAYQYRKAHELLFNFCNDTMSAVYLAAVKDRLYCDKADSTRRRRTQTAIHLIADGLIRLLAPVLPHTADEAWRALHGVEEVTQAGVPVSVHLVQFPQPTQVVADEAWDRVMAERDRALKLIEETRATQDIDNPLDLGLKIVFNPRQQHFYEKYSAVDLADLCGISRVELESSTVDLPESAMQVQDLRDEPRCERSWKRDGTVKQRSDGGWLSARDAEAVGVA